MDEAITIAAAAAGVFNIGKVASVGGLAAKAKDLEVADLASQNPL
mgnify:CR=1 FL=1